MPIIPLLVQNELESTDSGILISQFNYCDPFGTVYPISDGNTNAADMQHLFGLFSGILAASVGGATGFLLLNQANSL